MKNNEESILYLIARKEMKLMNKIFKFKTLIKAN